MSLRTPIQQMCYNAYRYALRYGLLVKGACNICGSYDRIEGHHDDHSRPLEVIWLCHTHHSSHHGKTLVRTPEMMENLRQKCLGHEVSQAARQRIRERLTGRTCSPEARQRMCESQQRRRDRERGLCSDSDVRA